MNILLPKAVTADMFGAGTTIPPVDPYTQEIAWVSGTSYAVKDRRVDGDYVYECVQAVTTAPQNTYAPSDARSAAYWKKDENTPTNRMAPFDRYFYTRARALSTMTYVLNPGFITGLALYLDADNLRIKVEDDLGNPLIQPVEEELWEAPFDEYEYLFGDLKRRRYFSLKGLPLHPSAVVTVTAWRNLPTEEVSIDFLSVGTWKQFLAPLPNPISGAQYGMEAATRDYSITEDYQDGTYREIEGRKATDISLTCLIAAEAAPDAMQTLRQVLGKAVAVEVSGLPRYSHLNTVCRLTGKVRSISWPHAQVDLQMKGNT